MLTECVISLESGFDFQFYDWNGQRLEVTSGTSFRPSVILSSGPSLLVRFYANGGSGIGYKAFYSFLSGIIISMQCWVLLTCKLVNNKSMIQC